MSADSDLLKAIESDPADALAWLALADCLEEAGQDDRAELVRLREWLRAAKLKDPARVEKERRLGQLLLAGVAPAVPRRVIALTSRVSLTLALIPPGKFWMGSDPDDSAAMNDERPRHRVTLTKPFWIGTTSVTNGQWRALMEPTSAAGPRPTHPKQNAIFTDCRDFLRALGKLDEGAYRLPTEAEWEYACRAGVTYTLYLGEGADVDGVAWHSDNSNDHTHPVGTKTPNAWGLYDVLGNVWDWCADGKRGYSARAVTDPAGPTGPRRVVKGGAWRSSHSRCRAESRYAEETRRQTDDQGFRVVMDWA